MASNSSAPSSGSQPSSGASKPASGSSTPVPANPCPNWNYGSKPAVVTGNPQGVG